MRIRTLPFFAILFALAAAAQQPASSYKSLKYPPLNQIKVPEPVRFELPNGMVVYLVEDHELPKVTLHATVRVGSRWDPAGKAGLASITGTVMRTGGSTTQSGDQLDEELDRLGASVETGIQEDSGGAFASLLKEDLDRGLAIMADLLQHPAFPQDKIDLAKIAARDSIARRNDNPNGIAFREFNRVIFGKDSAYARMTEYATIDSITRDDLVAFHKRFFQPESTIFGAEGDFNAAEMRARIEKAFGGWARGGGAKLDPPAVDDTARNRTGFYSIDKDSMEQSWVVMGMLAGRRDDPDYCALEVMNEILGGGFASRLFSNVRSAQGLAYYVFSNAGAGWDRPGTFAVGGSTKPETTLKIYRSMREQVEKLAASGATADEIARAKDGILKGMAFDFDSTQKILTRMMNYEYYGYPRDYLQRYRDGIEKVTAAQVAEVAGKYLKPAQFAVLVLGKEKGYDGPVSSLGAVSAIDISIPQPKQEAVAAANPEAAARGKELMLAARAAMGGKELMKVKDVTIVADAVMSTPQGDISLKTESTMSMSGKMLNKIQSSMGEMTVGFDGQAGWMGMGAQTRPMPPSQTGELNASMFRQSIALLQNFDKPGYTVQALGPAQIEGKSTEVVAVSDAASSLQLKVFIEPSTNLIVMKRYTAALMGPPTETEEFYSDYRDIKGVKMPFRIITRQGGKVGADMTVTDVKMNPGIPDAWYKLPASK
ncbi:MAG TPA: pitrilysin family protein [Bryobacteraceae bacterium]|nr:pitrilysin family protein [Bryobacteraceae bacterium]